jgi:vacuolar-type H+-ATPase subunit H
MSNAIEEALRALTEFESELDSAKAIASEGKQQMVKRAGEWAEAAKAEAIAEARRIASETVSRARSEAEKEAASMRKKGELALEGFEQSLSKRMAEAAELAARALLGESS